MNAVPTSWETERLWLRAPHQSDARLLVEAIQASLPTLLPWMEWIREDYDFQDARTYLIAAHDSREVGQFFSFFLYTKAENRFVGCVSLQHFEPTVPRVAIGYWLDSRAVGCGYATEAVVALCEIAVESLEVWRVEIECDARNEKSKAVALRAGFTLEAHLRNDRRDHFGVLSDTLIYARVRDETP